MMVTNSLARRYHSFATAHRLGQNAARAWRVQMHEICLNIIASQNIGVLSANNKSMER